MVGWPSVHRCVLGWGRERGRALLWGLSSDWNVGSTGVPPEARGAGRQQQLRAGLDSQQDLRHPEGPGLPEPIFPVSHPPTQGVVKRDELVFRIVRGRQLPILMVTSGGYQKRTARIIADSILNLYSLGLIGPESASVSAQNSDTPLLPLEVP